MSQNNPHSPKHAQDSTIASNQSEVRVTFQPGTTVLNKFKVIRLLGSGGMGSVYEVENLETGSKYALKFLHRQQTNDATWRRFDIEAKTSNKLEHPNLIKVHESGLLPDGQPFFIMDLVHGESLADILKLRGRLTVNQAVKIFIQVGFALSYAHANGVIHRDIKPSNIMLEKNPEDLTGGAIVKVVDFGIAKLTGKDDTAQLTLTRTGEIFGSPLYMSPEQCMGTGVDHRSDLYSLGCVFYEALTGAPPLMGDNALSTMMKHQSEDALPLKEASLGIEYPEQIERIIARLLAKELDKRYQSAQAFTSDLVNFDSGLDTIVPLFEKVEPIVQTRIRPLYVGKLLSCYLALLFAGSVLGTYIPREKQEKFPVRSYEGIALSTEDKVSASANTDIELSETGNKIVDEFSPEYLKMCHARLSTMEREPGFFSVIDKKAKTRTFHFPDFSLGIISESGGRHQKARGTIEFSISRAIAYTPSYIFKSHPKLFKKFRPEEIEVLSLKNQVTDLNPETIEFSNTDKVLENITHLRNLRELHMMSTEVSSKAWLLVNNFHKLRVLSLSHVKIKSSDIAKFKGFKQLEYFKLVVDTNVTPVLEQIRGSRKLTNLCLSRCDITDKDVEILSALPNLEELELRDTNITDIAIDSLPQSLRLLDINKCKLTSASVPKLARLKNLRLLILDRETFHSSDIHQLLRDNQNLEIEFAITEEEKLLGRSKPARVSNEHKP